MSPWQQFLHNVGQSLLFHIDKHFNLSHYFRLHRRGPLWLWQEKVQQSLFLSRVINNKAQVENVKVLNGAEEFEMKTAWYGSLPPHIFYCSADKAIKNNDSQTSLLSKLLTLVMKICQMIMNQIRGNNLTFNWKKWAQTPTELQFIWCQNTS